MRALILTLTLAAIAFAGCTDDGDAEGDNIGNVLTDPILAVAGDALGTLTLSEDVPLDSTPTPDQSICQFGRIGYGSVDWEIPDVDPDTGGAWIAQTMTIDASAAGQSASAGTGFVLEVIGPDGSQLDTVAAESGNTATATIQDAEAGVYELAIHACESAAGLAQTVEQQAGQANAAFQVDGSANMVAAETIYGEADGSASGDVNA